MTNTAPLEKKKLKQEIDKLQLEKSKLTEEIRHLKRPLIKNPQFLAPIAAIVFGLLTVGYSFFTGLWDVKRATLENEKILLQTQIDSFKVEKQNIRVSNVKLTEENAKLIKETKLLRDQYKQFASRYNSEKKDISNELILIDNLLKADRAEDANKKMKDLVTRLTGISQRTFDKTFDETFE